MLSIDSHRAQLLIGSGNVQAILDNSPPRVGLNLIGNRFWLGHLASSLRADEDMIRMVYGLINKGNMENVELTEKAGSMSAHQYLSKWIKLMPPMINLVHPDSEIDDTADIVKRLHILHEMKCSAYEKDKAGRNFFAAVNLYRPELKSDPEFLVLLTKLK